MKHHSLSSKWLLLVFLTHSTYFTATHTLTIPRLSPVAEWETTIRDPAVAIDKDKIKTFYYKQILDHFNYRPESYTTFQQRYLINFEYWGGANSSAPIFAYFGAEAPIDNSPNTIGFLVDNAASFNALLVYIEHRYYGRSVPFGSREEALKNGSTIGYFNSAQAIADYAAILIHIKKKLHTHNSPVIVIGGSYGGMLASWFRLKYPHLAVGALASSAPILYFDNITPQNGYYSVVTRDYREASETCYETIQKSWSEIHRVASLPDGLSILSHRFNTCKPLNEAYELMEDLRLMYVYAAQYNHPPRYPVNVICGGIDGASFGRDILSKIFAGVVAYKGNTSCKVNAPTNASETTVGWKWQNIKLVLQRFGSNIIFSNGLRDPYSSGGVLENISDNLLAVHTVNGSHCLDILRANQSDPEWLVEQRKKEIKIMKEWIAQYYADFDALKGTHK
ncbi:lysosomal Pro-X carboxypeptidase-like isoform X2 [Abrus precatorius]|uniref:Lysosomal Pro-X carboxypeptidase-like isoform X2 n=1 Tax=Abrus precatorius TaxID=3816 RepID=A0A8B8LZG8_ABRPR|nr:lysosomal Pro-X carboxypeptidase-like isoform X2 [Abrus precatorius]